MEKAKLPFGMNQIDAVIFDMDGVLCHLDDETRIDYLANLTQQTPTFVRDAIWVSGFEDLADEGVYSAEEYLEGFGRRLHTSIQRDDWVAYRKSGTIPMPHMLELAGSLSSLLSTCVLTNNGHLLQEEIDRIFPGLSPIFDGRVWTSAEFRCRKPSTEIYLRTCEKLGTEPSRTLMIDDRPENIEGAKGAGLEGHLFTDIERLSKYLDSILKDFPNQASTNGIR